MGKWPAALAAGALIGLPLTGLAARSEGSDYVVIGRATATGAEPVARAHSESFPARSYALRVTAAPDRQVTGTWRVSCVVGETVGRSHRFFHGRTPLIVVIPLTLSGGGACDVYAAAGPEGPGRVTVEVLAR